MTEVSWRWLESTRKLQEEAFGVDFTEREAGPQLADNLVHQGFALIIELAEAFAEVQWKDWAKDRGRHDRDAFIGELVDVGHFLANLLIHFNVTDDEWEALYQAKQDRNRARQAATGGYDARATKCPGCQRELDKPGATAWDSHHMMIVCSGCGKLLGSRLDFHSVVTWLDEVDGSQVWVGAVIVTRCPECGSDLEKPGHAVRDGFSVTCRNCDTILARQDEEGELRWHLRITPELADSLWAHTGTECTCEEYGIGKPSVDSRCPACKPVIGDNGIVLSR